MFNNELILIDEVLTPDSSRFWSAKNYQPEKVRTAMTNNREGLSPEPRLGPDLSRTCPADYIVEKAIARYREIYEIITG